MEMSTYLQDDYVKKSQEQAVHMHLFLRSSN